MLQQNLLAMALMASDRVVVFLQPQPARQKKPMRHLENVNYHNEERRSVEVSPNGLYLYRIKPKQTKTFRKRTRRALLVLRTRRLTHGTHSFTNEG